MWHPRPIRTETTSAGSPAASLPSSEAEKKLSAGYRGLGKQVGPERPQGAVRMVKPSRDQATFQVIDLDQQLPADHLARLVWRFVETLDLSPLQDGVRAREGRAGLETGVQF